MDRTNKTTGFAKEEVEVEVKGGGRLVWWIEGGFSSVCVCVYWNRVHLVVTSLPIEEPSPTLFDMDILSFKAGAVTFDDPKLPTEPWIGICRRGPLRVK